MSVRLPLRALVCALATVLLCAALVATIARAAGPPVVATGTASAVTSSSATVSGTVNPAGSATTYAFEYGTTTAYGTTTSATSAGSGSADVDVSTGLTGLSPGTEYHYRIRATNGDGTTVGADRTFTTDAAVTPAPTVSTGGASSVGARSARLSASVNPQGVATKVVFDFGPTTGYGSTSAVVDAGSDSASRTVSVTISGLDPRRTYHYRARATSVGGETVGSDRTFTTTAPPRPGLSTGQITGATPTSGTLNGRVDPNGFATSAYVEFGTSTRFGRRTPSVALGSGDGAVPVAITVGGLSTNTKYSMRFVVVNAGGTRRGTTRSFTTPRVPAVASLTVTPNPVTWGSRAQIIGSVSGTGAAGSRVTLIGSAYPFTAPLGRVGELTADGSGAFAFLVNPRITTRYRVRAVVGPQTPESRTVRLNVKPRVGITVRRRPGRRVRFSGNVAPRGGGAVSLRKITASGRIVTIARTRTVPAGPRSRYAVTIRAPRTTARYLVRVVPTTRTLVRGESRVVVVRGRR